MLSIIANQYRCELVSILSRCEISHSINMPQVTTESHITSSTTTKTAGTLHTSTPISLSNTRTSPAQMNEQVQSKIQVVDRVERSGPDSIDPTALSKALKDMEDAGQSRERTPGGSPSRKRQRVYGDRSVELLSHLDILRFCKTMSSTAENPLRRSSAVFSLVFSGNARYESIS